MKIRTSVSMSAIASGRLVSFASMGLALLVSCASAASPASPELRAALSAPSVPFQTIFRGSLASADPKPMETPQTAVFRSEADLEAFPCGSTLKTLLPAIDFSKQQGLFVFLPPQSTGEASVEITAIEETPDHFVAHVVRWLPPPGVPQTTDIGYPCDFVAMARSDKPVQFASPVNGTYDQRPTPHPSPSGSAPAN